MFMILLTVNFDLRTVFCSADNSVKYEYCLELIVDTACILHKSVVEINGKLDCKTFVKVCICIRQWEKRGYHGNKEIVVTNNAKPLIV